MLQLQLKNLVAVKLSKKVTFFSKLLLCCLLAHITILVLFFILTQSRVSVVVNTQSNNASVSFVPFLKAVPPQQKLHNAPTLKKDIVQKSVREEKKAVPKQIKPLPAKKNSTIMQRKKDSATISKKKAVVPPVKKNSTQKKLPPAKQEKPIAQKIEKSVQPKICEKASPTHDVSTTATAEQQQPKQETVIIGNDERELFVMQDILKKDIVKKWKRPTNIPDTAVCEFRVIVHKDGKRDISMEKSSNAIALDISARNFLLTYDFPKQWVEKELSIIF